MVLLANVALIHTNLIKNTKEHERDHRKDDSSHKTFVLRELVFILTSLARNHNSSSLLLVCWLKYSVWI